MKWNAQFSFPAVIALILLFTGCAAPPVKDDTTVFYPPPPSLPRIQFLTSYTGAKDVEGEKSGFEAFVTGEKESMRRLDKPYGVAIYEGKIYVCDTNKTVYVFDLTKKTFDILQGAKGIGKLIQPINISIDRDGNKFVTDPIRGQIVVFDRNDFYVKAIGMPGGWKPVDAVPYEDRLYVADIENSEIKVFDIANGQIIKSFGAKGDKPDELLDRPVNLAFDNDGYLYITDAGRIQVIKYDRDGHFISAIGKVGTNVGHFQRPRGVAADREGKIFVVDAAYYNVQVFTKEGQNLLYFGEGGTKPGKLILPAGITIDYDNMKYFEQYVDPNFAMEFLVFVTSQFGDRQVNVFAFGKEKGQKYPTDEELLEQLKERLRRDAKKTPEKPGEESKDAVQEKPADAPKGAK
jgi:DNA-binding beta-propeller fold protein YncE